LSLPVTPRVDAEVDALIVGAGPVGLYAAYCAGFRGLSVAIMDSLPEIGGQVSAMYPEKLIYDVAGFPAVRGRDLVAGLTAQAGRYRPRYLLGGEASRVRFVDGSPLVTTSTGVRVLARFVVVTGGIGTFTPRRLDSIGRFEGNGLAYFVPWPEDYRGKDVVIVGGGDSAFDWALTLAPLANSVLLVHRGQRFRAHEALVRRVRELSVSIMASAEVVAGHGSGLIEAVDVLDKRSRQIQRVETQAVVAALGFIADIRPFESWGLEIADRRIVVGPTMATNLGRVYAAGDIAGYPGKVRLMSVGFGEAATAVNNAVAALFDGSNLFPGHSTDAADCPPAAGDAQEPRGDATQARTTACLTLSRHPASTSWTSPASRSARSTASMRVTGSFTSIRPSASSAARVNPPARRPPSSSTGERRRKRPSSWRTIAGFSRRRSPAGTAPSATPAAAPGPAGSVRTRRWSARGDSPWWRGRRTLRQANLLKLKSVRH
jgi:ferredoxin/flavodoxin---NADP+ reductase